MGHRSSLHGLYCCSPRQRHGRGGATTSFRSRSRASRPVYLLQEFKNLKECVLTNHFSPRFPPAKLKFMFAELTKEHDMPLEQAISMVLERHPDLKLEGLDDRILQWCVSMVEAWFAADADEISLKN